MGWDLNSNILIFYKIRVEEFLKDKGVIMLSVVRRVEEGHNRLVLYEFLQSVEGRIIEKFGFIPCFKFGPFSHRIFVKPPAFFYR